MTDTPPGDVNGDNPATTIGARLRHLREARGWSQQRLVDAYNTRNGGALDRSALARIESGKRGLSFDEAGVLADALGITLTDLRAPDNDRDTEAAHAALAQWQRTFTNHVDALHSHTRALPDIRARAPHAPWHPDMRRNLEAAQTALASVHALMNPTNDGNPDD